MKFELDEKDMRRIRMMIRHEILKWKTRGAKELSEQIDKDIEEDLK